MGTKLKKYLITSSFFCQLFKIFLFLYANI